MTNRGLKRIECSSVEFLRLAALTVMFALSSCGGGGGSGGGASAVGSSSQPTIIASVLTFPSNAVPPGFLAAGYNTGAVVRVTDQTGAVITSASITVNGSLLTYVAADQQYEGALTINPGVTVALQATINGIAYSVSHQNFSTYPTISLPTANSTWSDQAANVVSWSGVTTDSASQYAVGVLDATGSVVWPAGGRLMVVPPSTTTVTIGAGSLSTGNRLVLVGIVEPITIAGATAGSGLVIGGFRYVPITVSVPAAAPQSISISPASVTVGVSLSTQLAATVTFSDGTTQDITAQAAWSSSNAAIATISSSGIVKGVAGGSATVTAQYGGFSASTAVSVFQPNPSPPPPLSQAVTYQIDYAHSGRATVGGSGPVFPPTSHWATTLNGTSISYPVIAGGNVFVLTNAAPSGAIYGTTLYAINEVTGSVVWGPTPIAGTYSFAGIAYDHGTLFVVNFDGVLRSFDAATGTPGWSAQMPATQVTSPPTATNGIVYVGGNGGVAAVDETNGNILYNVPISPDHSSPAVSPDGVFTSNPCYALKLDPIVGTVLWRFDEGCSGGGGKTVAYANSKAYVRQLLDTATTTNVDLIFDAATGKQLGTFNSSVIPAFSATTGFFLSNGELNAIDLATGSPNWSFAGDGQLVSAPIVIDNALVVGSSSGMVYAIGSAGNVLWSGPAGAPISAPDEQNAMLLTGFGAGDGYLVVPAGNVLNGWRVIP
jgi:hypothetical protein